MITARMLEKYLRKEHDFWRINTSDGRRWYCKHSGTAHGIYAYAEQGVPGMTLVAGSVTLHVIRIAEASEFLARAEQDAAREHRLLVQALQRSSLARTLRTLSL